MVEARDAIAEWARIWYGWIGRSPDYKAAFLATLGANAAFYDPYTENVTLVQARAGGSFFCQSRHRQSAGRPRQAARRGKGRVYARGQGKGRRTGCQRARWWQRPRRSHTITLSRTTAHSRSRPKNLRSCAWCRRTPRVEIVLSPLVRNDGRSDGHAVRLPAVVADGRE